MVRLIFSPLNTLCPALLSSPSVCPQGFPDLERSPNPVACLPSHPLMMSVFARIFARQTMFPFKLPYYSSHPCYLCLFASYLPVSISSPVPASYCRLPILLQPLWICFPRLIACEHLPPRSPLTKLPFTLCLISSLHSGAVMCCHPLDCYTIVAFIFQSRIYFEVKYHQAGFFMK